MVILNRHVLLSTASTEKEDQLKELSLWIEQIQLQPRQIEWKLNLLVNSKRLIELKWLHIDTINVLLTTKKINLAS